MDTRIKYIDMGLMLDVISILPRVDAGEVDEMREAITDAVNSYEGQIPFVRGEEGDGVVFVQCDWSTVYEDQQETTLSLNDDGWLVNGAVDFEARVPFRVARYFMATVFGMEELTPLAQKHFYVDKKKAAGLEDDSEEGYVPAPTPEYVPELLKGASLLYECADLAGDISYCGESEGMKIIDVIKERIEKEGGKSK